MPIPRYTPGSGHLGAAQPILDTPGAAYNNAVDFASHPIDSLKGMLGMNPAPPPEQGPTMLDEANKTFVKPTPNPVVAPPPRMRTSGQDYRMVGALMNNADQNREKSRSEANWSMGQGPVFAPEKDYMQEVGKQGILRQQEGMRNTADAMSNPPRRKPMNGAM